MAAAQVRTINDDKLVEVMGLVAAQIYRDTDAKIAALEAQIHGLQEAVQELRQTRRHGRRG